jgi:UDP-GlcNAc:undecaprenyl-phosphate/decaprenyl-phosphate GlcNAc-1-phosphate transferase
MNITYLGVFVTAVLLSFLLTRKVRNLANSRGWVYVPPSARHIHTALIPSLGGVAIYIAVVVVAVTLIAFPSLPGVETALSRRTVFYILGPATLIFLLGLYDDFRPVRPYVKFLVQAVAATLMFSGGFGVFQLPFLFGSYTFGWLALPLTIVWVLWITNAFNLLDGIDGLAAGSALFSTLTVFVVSLIGGNFLISGLTLALAGSILGFLRFNFNPATIFLGDCGSLFIGFMLSALALAGAGKTPTIVAVAIPVVSFGLPVLETVLSVFRRFLSGQPLFGGDRGHIHHKLLERGFSQRQVVLILYSVSAVCGLLSLFLLYPNGSLLGVVLFVIGTGIWMGVQHLGYHEFIELGRAAHRTIQHKKIIFNNLMIRRATEALSISKDMEGVDQILRDTFETNDFDGFNLTLDPVLAGRLAERERLSQLTWRRSHGSWEEKSEWTLTLDLLRSTREKLGTFSINRKCNGAPLFVDINLLISGFSVALGGAVERAINNTAAEPAGAKETIKENTLPSGLHQNKQKTDLKREVVRAKS